MSSVSEIGKTVDTDVGQSSTLILGCLGCHVTAMSQLPREANKFLLAYVMLSKCDNFQQYFICLHERIAAMC